MKTTLHTFDFDTFTPEGKSAWQAFKKAREAEGARIHGPVLANVHLPYIRLDGCTVELETKFLFDNQWNTAATTESKGMRLFDFALQADSAPHAGGDFSAPRGRRRGHYLAQTEEMKAIRRETLKCRYCGKQHAAAAGLKFCDGCFDSQYLKAEDLHLTRLMPVFQCSNAIQPLTDEERAELMPRYTKAQIFGETERGKARIAHERAKLAADKKRTIEVANRKFEGFTWIMDHGIQIDNVIYYDHMAGGQGVFSFGWRKPLSKEETDIILDLISEFPFNYQLVTDHRGKLENFGV